MSLKNMLVASLMVWGVSAPALGVAQENRNVEAYNLEEGVGLKGFDPVAVFPEGGGEATAGDPEIALDYEGVTYYFVSEENRDLFLETPEKYEPTYGGWCAFAMASGSYIDIKPEIYTINGNRAHYFVARRAKRNFDRDIEGFEINADRNWKILSGEEPRM